MKTSSSLFLIILSSVITILTLALIDCHKDEPIKEQPALLRKLITAEEARKFSFEENKKHADAYVEKTLIRISEEIQGMASSGGNKVATSFRVDKDWSIPSLMYAYVLSEVTNQIVASGYVLEKVFITAPGQYQFMVYWK